MKKQSMEKFKKIIELSYIENFEESKMKNAIILCSGGLDSSVTAYYIKKKQKYDNIIFLFFNYGQRTLEQERGAAKNIAKKIKADFKEVKLDFLKKISTSLINKKTKARKIKRKELKDMKKEGEKYYVPCRNIVFLIYALALSESLQIKKKQVFDIFTGFKCEGKEAYPDTTREFVAEMNRLKKISTNAHGKIIAPLINLDKDEIILLGKKLGINFKDTYSCYIGSKNGKHCGCCLSCRLRQEAFYWANVKDPTGYKEKMRDYRKA